MEIYNVGVNGFNSYLLISTKTVLIDTVPKNCIAGFFKNIEEHTSVYKIDAVVFTKTAPDSSGAFTTLLKENPCIDVFASVAGLKNLKEIANRPFSEQVVKNGGQIDLGADTLEFLITPNLSWPDTFMAYLHNEKALFSGNLFCDSPEYEFFQKEFLENALRRINELCISSVYPSYTASENQYSYKDILYAEPEEKLALVYSTVSGSTEELAKVVCLEALSSGISAVLLNVNEKSTEEILNEINSCKYLAFGTPTLNHKASEKMIELISKINITKNTEKNAFVFGSYGWSGEGVNIISGLLQNLKIKTFKRPYRCIFSPSAENIDALKNEVKNFLKEVQNNA